VSGVAVAAERRARARVSPQRTSWPRAARLRPGQEVYILNISAGGALVESINRLKPGARIELHLLGPARCVVPGRIDRCRVIGIEPMLFEAAIAFEEPLADAGSE
jgi:hypothetical protein